MRIEAQRRPVAPAAGAVPRPRADFLVGPTVRSRREDGDDLGPDETGTVGVRIDEKPVAGKAAGDERHGAVEPAEAASTRDDALDRQLARHRAQSPRSVSGVRPKAFRTARRLIAE